MLHLLTFIALAPILFINFYKVPVVYAITIYDVLPIVDIVFEDFHDQFMIFLWGARVWLL